jgi:vacuolar-type H+-ATPase catalytic subunit A/Vma1
MMKRKTIASLRKRFILDEWMTKAKKITKIGYQLEHSYTYQSIGFSSLKSRDEIVLATLRNARNSNGEKLFYVAILLMEYYRDMDYMHDKYDSKMKSYKLIEENIDGSISETDVEGNDD